MTLEIHTKIFFLNRCLQKPEKWHIQIKVSNCGNVPDPRKTSTVLDVRTLVIFPAFTISFNKEDILTDWLRFMTASNTTDVESIDVGLENNAKK